MTAFLCLLLKQGPCILVSSRQTRNGCSAKAKCYGYLGPHGWPTMYFDVPGLIKSIDTSDFKDLTSQVIGDVLLNVHSLSKFGFLGGICSDEDRFCRKRTNRNVF